RRGLLIRTRLGTAGLGRTVGFGTRVVGHGGPTLLAAEGGCPTLSEPAAPNPSPPPWQLAAGGGCPPFFGRVDIFGRGGVALPLGQGRRQNSSALKPNPPAAGAYGDWCRGQKPNRRAAPRGPLVG